MKGFTRIRPLLEVEWSFLVEATLARLLQLQIWTLHAANQNPDNSNYILQSNEAGWRVFDKLISEETKKTLASWRNDVILTTNAEV